ncbi:MAG: acyltransferase [Desulfovibrio sp.]|nr:acyltransferase [Desulfovibrio sp.]
MKFFRKALARGLTPANTLCWLSIKGGDYLGAAWGTARLRLKASLLGVSLGRKVRAHGTVSLIRWPGGEIEIGDNVSIISSWRRATAAALAHPARLRVFGPGAKIEIGPDCQLSGTSITARSRIIRLGKGVLIGPNCVIVDSDFHSPWPAEARSGSPGYENDAPVSIGDYVWIGMNSIILKGAEIGEGAIIGAGSVVTGNIPACSVACGVPARVVKRGARP